MLQLTLAYLNCYRAKSGYVGRHPLSSTVYTQHGSHLQCMADWLFQGKFRVYWTCFCKTNAHSSDKWLESGRFIDKQKQQWLTNYHITDERRCDEHNIQYIYN